jgi:hypothetical protein
MIKYITGNTLANTVRMGARSRRPKAVFLANDKADIELVQALLSESECRIIPTHSRENAAEAFEILVKSGYEGVFTAINARFAPADDEDVLRGETPKPNEIVGIEGIWEDVQSQGSLLSGQLVRVTLVSNPAQHMNRNQGGSGERGPNVGMLQALEAMQEVWKGMNPKKDDRDYLREARSGAMYDLGDAD